MVIALIAALLCCTAVGAVGGFVVGQRRGRARGALLESAQRCGDCGNPLSPRAFRRRSIAGKGHAEVEALLGTPTLELITNQGLQVSYCDGEVTVLYVDGTATWFLVPPATDEDAWFGTTPESRADPGSRQGSLA